MRVIESVESSLLTAASSAAPSRRPTAPPQNYDAPAGIRTLHDRSLLHIVSDRDYDKRFRMLNTVRAFAEERLEERPEELKAAKAAHALHFRTLAEDAAKDMRGPDELSALRRQANDHDNLAAALRWAIDQKDAETALRLVGALWQYWNIHGHLLDGRKGLEEALALREENFDLASIEALNGAGTISWVQGDYAATLKHADALEAAAIRLNHTLGRAEAIYLRGLVARSEGREGEAAGHFADALRLFRMVGALPWIGLALTNIGSIAFNRYRQLSRDRQADTSEAEQLLAEAEERQEDALAQFTKAGHEWGIALALARVGEVERERGKLKQALAHYVQSLHMRHAEGSWEAEADTLLGLGCVAAQMENWEASAKLFGRAEALHDHLGINLSREAKADMDGHVAAAQTILTDEGYDLARAAGHEMSHQEVINLVNSLSDAAGA
jgi:hypothetical protein